MISVVKKIVVLSAFVGLVPLQAMEAIKVEPAKADANKMAIFSGGTLPDLSQSIAKGLGIPLGKASVGRFNDGEVSVKIDDNVRKKHVYVVQSVCATVDQLAGEKVSVNDRLMEAMIFINAAKLASAKSVTLVVPYLGYSRQDRKMEGRTPISASVVAMMLTQAAEIDRVITLDLHAGQIQGFYGNTPVDNLAGYLIFAEHIARTIKGPISIVSPDAGGVARAKQFVKKLGKLGVKDVTLATMVKMRAGAGIVESCQLSGDVTGRTAIVVDDLCDTGGTLIKAAEELKEFGAGEVHACITHPVFSKDAIEKLEGSSFKSIVVSDSIPLRKPLAQDSKIVVLTIAPLLAEVIRRVEAKESVSVVF